MTAINYIGEELFWGKLGNALIIAAFCSALLSTCAFLAGLFRKTEEHNSWRKLARTSFHIHSASILGIVVLIFYLIHNHRFEYYYVWQHSSLILPLKYMWACFWEGQEGSFLLWTFWHIVLGYILIKKAGNWEIPVMAIVMMVQVFLCSMVLGLEFGSVKIGSNPFILLRNHVDFANLPFVQMPDYLSKIKDGRGLNPLLQNYWMVIHPPTLFLGFASTLIPFAYAMGGLLKRDTDGWIKPALPWAFFSIMILGTGILMGGAWAYEALSFGGFWAWDPVENASLVPWITMVAGAHVLLIYKKSGRGLITAILLIALSFLLVLYSTFLTRSGILGDTSVHAFTDLGMTGQLIIYMVFFVMLATALLIINFKKLKSTHEDEHILSREFWMFIGALVLLISAIQISFTTSLPVINKLIGTKIAPPADAISFYNAWQVPIASIIALLFAVTQFLKYKVTNANDFIRKILVSLIASVVIAVALGFFLEFHRWQLYILMFSCILAFFANLDYFIRILKGKIKHAGASIAHIGMALILLGSLISNAKQEVISRNVLNVDLGKDFPNQENILMHKNDTLAMGEYYVSYRGKQKEGVNVYFDIDYYKANHETGKFEKAFTLKPLVQLNERMGNVAEPATKRFLSKDIYTHITFADLDQLKEENSTDKYAEVKYNKMAVGDTISASNSLIVLEALDKDVDRTALLLNENDLAIKARLKVIDVNNKIRYAEPVFLIKGQNSYTKEALVEELGLKFIFNRILPEENKMEIGMAEKKENKRDFIIMKAIIFPQINILWIGCLLMMLGSLIAIRHRIADLKRSKS